MNFGNIKISEATEKNISALVDEGRLSHAVLLTGSAASDRKKAALAIASALYCTGGGKNKPCGKCSRCVRIKKEEFPDVTLISKDKDRTNIPIDVIKQMKRNAYLLPNESDFQTFIITDAESLRPDAQNSLLKILEEPPETARFILCAKDKSSILETILSRVEQFSLTEDSDIAAGGKIGKKAETAADSFLDSLVKGNEYSAMISLAPLIKDRNNFMDMAEKCMLVFRDALFIGRTETMLSGSENRAKELRKKFSDKNLIKMTELFDKSSSDAIRNISMTSIINNLISECFTL